MSHHGVIVSDLNFLKLCVHLIKLHASAPDALSWKGPFSLQRSIQKALQSKDIWTIATPLIQINSELFKVPDGDGKVQFCSTWCVYASYVRVLARKVASVQFLK